MLQCTCTISVLWRITWWIFRGDIYYVLLGNKDVDWKTMDFFFDLFDSEKKRRQQLQQQQQQRQHYFDINSRRNRTGSGGELPPLRRNSGYHRWSFRKYDPRDKIRDERIRRELHRLYLWDSKCLSILIQKVLLVSPHLVQWLVYQLIYVHVLYVVGASNVLF